jgi:dUTP pyrophosphatase
MFKVMSLRDGAMMPSKSYKGDAGFDVYNNGNHEFIKPGCRSLIILGFAMEIASGWVALIQEKSGMALSQGILTIGNVIDSNYRGEVHAILVNLSDELVVIKPKQKVAQMLMLPCYTDTRYDLVVKLMDSDRGTDGFGSTGVS